MKFILIRVLLVCFPCMMNAQVYKQVIGLPEDFKRPKDKTGTEYKDFILSKSSYDKERPWLVMADRANLKSYSEPNDNSTVAATHKFKDIFFVVKDEGEWLRIVKVPRALKGLQILPGTEVKDLGWIRRDQVLLWRSTLRNPDNGIHLKSLLLYSDKAVVDIAKGDIGKSVKFLDAPNPSAKILDDRLLYDFFFVLKKENGYLLLSTEADLSMKSDDPRILGWIPETKQAPWNTRLCLEPNFQAEAFKERKNRTNFRVNCFRQSLGAVDNFRTGNVNNPLLIYDPVVADPKEIAKDGYRFKGHKMRLPVLEANDEYFSTGVLGSLDESGNKQLDDSKMAEVQGAFANYKKKRSNWNFFFLIEASESMRAWKPTLVSALEGIKKNLNGEESVRFAVGFYRDPKLNGQMPYFNLKKRTSDLNDIYKFINAQEFVPESPDQHTALNYALNQSLIKSGFADGETNILYLFANNPDFTSDVMLQGECSDCPEKVSVNEVASLMEEKKIHFIVVQPSSMDQYLSRDLYERIEDLMIESSKRIYESVKGIGKMLQNYVKYENPSIIETATGKIVKNGPYVSRLIYAEVGQKTMTKTGLMTAILNSFNEINENETLLMDYLNKLLLSGESAGDLKDDVAVGKFGNGIVEKLSEILKGSGYNASSTDVINEIIKRKIRIYTQVYTSRKPAGATFESFSPVLFFPREELKDYVRELENISILRNKPDDEMRRELKDYLIKLFSKYSGNKKPPKDLDLNAVCRALAGNGFNFQRKDNFQIRDLLDADTQTETIMSFIEKISEKKEKLENIVNTPRVYSDYIYTTANSENYFWIPFEDVF